MLPRQPLMSLYVCSIRYYVNPASAGLWDVWLHINGYWCRCMQKATSYSHNAYFSSLIHRGVMYVLITDRETCNDRNQITFSVSPSRVWIMVEQQVSVVIWRRIQESDISHSQFNRIFKLAKPVHLVPPSLWEPILGASPSRAAPSPPGPQKGSERCNCSHWSEKMIRLQRERDLHRHVEAGLGATISIKPTSSVLSDACNRSRHLESSSSPQYPFLIGFICAIVQGHSMLYVFMQCVHNEILTQKP